MSTTEILKSTGGKLVPMPNSKITKEVKEYRAAFKRGDKIVKQRQKSTKKNRNLANCIKFQK